MIICKDAPGFVVNRLLTRFMGEVTDAVDEGTPADVADNALRHLDSQCLHLSSLDWLDLELHSMYQRL
jgi:3-hydroxyacyl-CoA dehydrogenase